MVVSVSGYQQFMANESTSKLNSTILLDCLSVAQNKIEDYIGFSLDSASYTNIYNYSGSYIFNLGNSGIQGITSVSLDDGIIITSDQYTLDNYHLIIDSSKVNLGYDNKVSVSFSGGWTINNVPSAIKLAIYYIAQAIGKSANFANGQATAINQGGQSITFDSTRYYRFYDYVKGYKIFEL
jgi:hypothetical protein